MAAPASRQPVLRAVPSPPQPAAWVPPTIRPIRTLEHRGPTRWVVGYHDLLGCDVTVESLPREASELADLFARQAKLTARLDHPSCARIDEYEEHEGVQFIVYRGAFTTCDEIDLPPSSRALSQISKDLLGALTHAHAQSIYHGRLDIDSLLFRLDDPSRVKLRGFSMHVDVGDTAALVRQDLDAAGRILWHLAAGHMGERADPKTVPAGMRLVVARLCGMPVRGRPAQPFASAKEALAELHRNSASTGGMVSTPGRGVTYSGPKSPGPLRPERKTTPPTPAVSTANARTSAPSIPSASAPPQQPIDARPSAPVVPGAAKRRRWVAIAGVLGGASLAAFVGIQMGAAMREQSAEPTPVAADASAASAQRYEKLARVNAEARDDLSYAERTRLLSELRSDPEVRDLIDERLQVAIQLEQAAQAPQPCEAFRQALRTMTADLHPYYRDVVGRARVPGQRSPACEGLQAQLEGLRAALAVHDERD